MEFLNIVLTIVAGLVGFPVFVAALVNVGKWAGWVKDGYAPVVSEVLHLIGYVGVGIAVLTGNIDLIPGIDVQLGLLANALLAVLAFLSSLGVARAFHENVLYGLPLVGFHHTSAAPWVSE